MVPNEPGVPAPVPVSALNSWREIHPELALALLGAL